MTLNYNGPRCACCIMPEAEGHITLGKNGVCSVCRNLQEKSVPSQSFDLSLIHISEPTRH